MKKLSIETIVETVNHPFPSFTSPPLSEVSIGLQFEALDRLRIPHFGTFWESFRKDFPLVEHAPPIINKDNAFQGDPSTGLPLPRVWFINKTETSLIQLQVNRYNFNWRVRDDAEPYPRYPEVAAKFFKYLDVLEGFLAETNIGPIQPTVVELTYINVFEQGKEWDSIDDIANIIRDFSWKEQNDRFLPNPKTLTWAASFPLPNDQGTLNAKLNHVRRIQDNQPMLQLEMAASWEVNGQTRESIESWYELAHEWIVKGFVDLTESDAQYKFWRRQE
ncbi:MAG: TIGR04255 family protein [Sulfuriferula sp.]